MKMQTFTSLSSRGRARVPQITVAPGRTATALASVFTRPPRSPRPSPVCVINTPSLILGPTLNQGSQLEIVNLILPAKTPLLKKVKVTVSRD